MAAPKFPLVLGRGRLDSNHHLMMNVGRGCSSVLTPLHVDTTAQQWMSADYRTPPTSPPDRSKRYHKCGFCNRPTIQILCRSCGHMFTGRVRRLCCDHPTTIQLMDYEACPECRSSHLKECDARLSSPGSSPSPNLPSTPSGTPSPRAELYPYVAPRVSSPAPGGLTLSNRKQLESVMEYEEEKEEEELPSLQSLPAFIRQHDTYYL